MYAEIGVQEYVRYDANGEYLTPALQGYRLQGGVYEAMEQTVSGALISPALGLDLHLEDGRLRLRDGETGAALLDPAERATAAEARIAELEAELRRLRGDASHAEEPER